MSSPGAWPEDITLPASSDHLEAVGAFGMFYNQLEIRLYSFIREYLPDRPSVAMRLFATLHNQERVELITTLIEDEPRKDVAAAVKHALKCFGVCSENRNLLLHAIAYGPSDQQHLTMIKSQANDPTRMKSYRFSVEDVRDAAVSAARTSEYSMQLCAWIRLKNKQPELERPLPDKPPQPRKLSLSALEEFPTA